MARLLHPLPLVALPLAALALSGCATGSAATGTERGVRVVAAENVWGSVARQLGGADATVVSIVDNPAQDPHAYEPTTSDARATAIAQLAIVNGAGYDPWAPRLLAADPVDGRQTLDVGALLGLHVGDNPHRWYDPADVVRVARAITARLQRLDPRHRAAYARRLSRFTTGALAPYHRLIATIRGRYAGTPIGASESIAVPLASALGLDLITPPAFLRAVSEGSDPTAQEIAASESQIAHHRIAVWLENVQNVTPEVQRLDALARAHHIPVVPVTETLQPATSTFQAWQTRQLRALQNALHRATGR